MAEFLGTMLLQLLAGSTSSPARAAAAYAGLSASFARHSGGHLNPTLSVAAALSGHLTWFTCFVYVVAQIVGALAGAAIQVLITPGLHFGTTFGPSCHVPITGMGGTPLYIWETLAAFVFVYVAYPAIFARPGYGSLAPLVLGVTLFGVVSTAGPYTGYSLLNPALSFASSWVFNCAWRWSWMYWLGQFTGAGVAALLGVGVFGMGPGYLSEEERVGYNTLPGDMRDAGLAGELSPTAAAPAGTF
jgi:aquaporin TIP